MRWMKSLLVGALLVVALGGCGADSGGSAGDPPTTKDGATVRERLAAGLAATNPDEAELVRRAGETTLEPVEASRLHGWQVFDVYWQQSSSADRFYAALSDDGTALMLSDSPDSFAQMARSAQIAVEDASTAISVGNIYLDVTRDFYRYSYRIDSIADVNWLPAPEPDEEQRQAELEAQYAAIVQPPIAVPTDTGWSVTIWMVYDRSLVRHDLDVATDGAVQDSTEVVEAEIPVPWSF